MDADAPTTPQVSLSSSVFASLPPSSSKVANLEERSKSSADGLSTGVSPFIASSASHCSTNSFSNPVTQHIFVPCSSPSASAMYGPENNTVTRRIPSVRADSGSVPTTEQSNHSASIKKTLRPLPSFLDDFLERARTAAQMQVSAMTDRQNIAAEQRLADVSLERSQVLASLRPLTSSHILQPARSCGSESAHLSEDAAFVRPSSRPCTNAGMVGIRRESSRIGQVGCSSRTPQDLRLPHGTVLAASSSINPGMLLCESRYRTF